jgi:hypothetical protein
MRDRVWVFAGAPPLLQHRLLLSPFVQTKFLQMETGRLLETV